jgi:hypothetical protein
MSDFFGALEHELRAAAERRPRRTIGIGQAIGALAAVGLLAAAVAVAALVSGGGGGDSARMPGGLRAGLDPVGTVIPKGKGAPPRSMRSVVVATGRIRYAGPWQLEIQPSERLTDDKGEVIQPGGLRCVWLYLPDPPEVQGPTGSGYCGPFPRTPGFTRGQANLANAGRGAGEPPPTPTKQVLVFGRTPERAKYVVVAVPGKLRMRSPVHEGPRGTRENYYVVGLPVHVGRGARINWLDSNGNPGSRGIPLLRPITN